jgi:uncharacterized protein
MRMNSAFKVAFAAFMLAAGFNGSVAAGPFEAAVLAHEKGVAADEKSVYATALRLLRPLAEQGEANAQYNLGLMFDNGRGVPRNYATAMSWYRKAAEQGHAAAQNNLGVMYAQGWGVPQDQAIAVSWYQKAAEQDYAIAQYNLGVMYDDGQGVPQDYAVAVSWYRKAAEQGDADAQVNLGILYGMGQGVPQDYVSAHMWFSLAVTGGHKDAMKARDMAAAKMTPAQIAEAKKLAREWRPKSTPVPPLVSGSRLLRSSDQQLWQPARR